MKKVLIIGGGFGGIAVAQELQKLRDCKLDITLISKNLHLEYQPALYRIVTGQSPLEACVPLSEIFPNKKLNIVIDTITAIDIRKKRATGLNGKHYDSDFLVIALGSEPAYFHIPGIEKFSFGFTTFEQALRLKKHLHEMFKYCQTHHATKKEKTCRLHFVIAGGGASGVELAGELALYTKKLALQHHIPTSLISIDLIEGAPRILPAFPASVSARVAQRLRVLGINIITEHRMVKENIEQLFMQESAIKTRTVIWTAGTKPNTLYQAIKDLTFNKQGRVMVDTYLQAKKFPGVFILGDGAATQYVGMAQTAIYDGILTAHNIEHTLTRTKKESYKAKRPYYSLPVGQGWAVTLMGPLAFYGTIGWTLRRLADMRYFFSILPPLKAMRAFRKDVKLCEYCEICSPPE
ncbi:MAG: FAD-dependent oxidoreductase [bacterium]|nr:FAD-dependent oxidoreductase [bacterium]